MIGGLHDNPFFSGGLTLMILGGAMARRRLADPTPLKICDRPSVSAAVSIRIA